MLRDILSKDAVDVAAAQDVITRSQADVVALQGFDFDLEGRALSAFASGIDANYPHLFAKAPNTGALQTEDLNKDGWLELPEDGDGYGRFAGQGGMAVLSRWPLKLRADFINLLWSDVPDNALLQEDPAHQTRRLSSVAHWVIEVHPASQEPVTLLAFHASPPVFDGPEDLNGRRNRDEILLWRAYLDEDLDEQPPNGRYAILGVANADPSDGDARRDGIGWLLSDRRLQDPKPRSVSAQRAAQIEGGANLLHRGDPSLDTANWRDDGGPGNLRVDYVLPSVDWTVLEAGVIWPEARGTDDPVGRHGLVWVDLIPGSQVLP